GWSLLVFVVVTEALSAGVFVVVQRFWTFPDEPRFTPGLLIVAELAQAAIVLAATLLMGRVERRTLAAYGLPLRWGCGRRFWEGALWGVGSCALVYLLMAAAGGYSVHGLALHGGEALRWPLLWALAFLAVALYEEPAFRGFELFTLTRGIGFWPA